MLDEAAPDTFKENHVSVILLFYSPFSMLLSHPGHMYCGFLLLFHFV